MSPDDTTDDEQTDATDGEAVDVETEDTEDGGEAVEVTVEDDGSVRDRLEEEADRAVEEFDDRLVDLLAWVLDTETRARIYVHLRQHPHSTSEEIAEGTGLYPSTVREALAELHEEEKVTRRKRESGGAGNNPYEYSAMAPSDLVSDVVDDVQEQLNTVFNLDSHLGESEDETEEPVTISVEDASEDGEE
ncbi:winged helix-turn-helix transcriptional regulator [Halapricum hydrolyticum]|uniref:Winged helix-turn-helix transcriptional regulator n=1 Tax=Halapricum hydrolyticum TaxID=2979991 RepID=A0AAE3ICY3_9EURY|nr:winged helix-turn-helix transcriptional regulator [Halapricum hydrolyticum]MCU4718950.1 winged helix-turn-helix transcriptional regulator [Halapricum hydrolyticum]MCU4727957.1 winged helix-turn-helix transcriptional regulator [Halapricum hydrolyticum]